tara:strand:+ start:54 stop:635 length:582 start_codon:yes stop_codon:yes gene_type:complete
MKYKIQITLDSEVEDSSEVLDFFNETVADLVPEYLEGKLITDYTTVEILEGLPTPENLFVGACVLFKSLSQDIFIGILNRAFRYSRWISQWEYTKEGHVQLWSKLVDFREDFSGKEISAERMRRSIIQMASPNKYVDKNISQKIRRAIIDSVEEPDFDELRDTNEGLVLLSLSDQICDYIVQWTCFKMIKFVD